jgi:hypothetical protein
MIIGIYYNLEYVNSRSKKWLRRLFAYGASMREDRVIGDAIISS